MSQVAAKKRLSLRNNRVKVVAMFREEGSVLAGTQRGTCEGFSIELSVDGEEKPEEFIKLARLAHRMCFTEHALSRVVKVTATHVFNSRPIDVTLDQR